MLFEGRDLPPPQLIPALDVLPHQRLSPHNEIAEKRAVGLWRLSARRMPITIVPVASALLRTESAEFYRQLSLTLRMGEELPLEDLVQHLESIGYERREPVEMVGEYSVRGGIFDVFPAEASSPVRVEFFGDEIESIRQFDVESQRSVLKVTHGTLLPLAEYPRSRALLRELAKRCRRRRSGAVQPWRSFSRMGVPGAAGASAQHNVAVSAAGCTALLLRRADGDSVRRRTAVATAGRIRSGRRRLQPEKNFARLGRASGQSATDTRGEIPGAGTHYGDEAAPSSFHIPTRPSLTFQRQHAGGGGGGAEPDPGRATAWRSLLPPPAKSSGSPTSCRSIRFPTSWALEI